MTTTYISERATAHAPSSTPPPTWNCSTRRTRSSRTGPGSSSRRMCPSPCLKGPVPALKEVERRVKATVRAGKIPVLLGGEHSGRVGAVAALRKRYGGFDRVAIRCPHGPSGHVSRDAEQPRVRRPADGRLGARLVQVGIRSMSEEEDRFLKKAEEVKTFYASEVRDNVADVTKGVVSSLSENVYISIDLDVFDPGIMPAVVTPEPGGLSWSGDRHPAGRDAIKPEHCRVRPDGARPDREEMAAPDYAGSARLCYRLMGWLVARRSERIRRTRACTYRRSCSSPRGSGATASNCPGSSSPAGRQDR